MNESERFWAKVEKTETCWLWRASLDSYGYGQFGIGRRNVRAHRFAYMEAHGDITGGVLDHVCRVRSCVNPGHLRVVTNAQNVLAGIGPTAENARKETCIRGHRLEKVDPRGWRYCNVCRNQQRRERRARQRQAAEAAREGDGDE